VTTIRDIAADDQPNQSHAGSRGCRCPFPSRAHAAARELDLAVAVVYRPDPSFSVPPAVWTRFAKARPTLLGPG